jgi:hypothetical protein
MKIHCLTILLLLQSCYGVNEKTSEIFNLNTNCLSKAAWTDISSEYSINKVADSVWLEKSKEFENQPFTTEVLYFSEKPQELIGIATDHYSVRYVYNPQISDEILDGLSSELNEKEMKRIGTRIQTLLMQYQCEKGKLESLKLIEE